LVDEAGRFDSFLRHLPGFAWMKDVEGRYVYANSALQKLDRFCNGWLGKTDADLWPEELAVVYRENDMRVVADRKPLEAIEPYVIDGKQHHAAVSKFPIMDETGAVVMIGGAAVDVTEREHDAQRLREYEKVVEGTEEMIAVIDRDYRYLLANRAFLRYRRKEREDVVGRFVWEVLNPTVFHDVIKPKLDQCFAGQVVAFEMEYNHQDSGTRDLRVSYLPIEGANGIDRVACVLHDITTRRSAEEALKQSERQMAEAQHLAHVGSWTWEIETDVLAWSEELYRIFGESPETFTPSYTSFLEHVHPDEREATAKAIEQCLRDQRSFSARRRIVRPSGEIRVIDTHLNIGTDENGKPLRMFGACQDVTSSVRAEKARRLAEQKYQDIFDNAREGIFQTTPDGHFLVANPALARMHGFDSPADLIRERTDIPRDVYVDPARRDEFKRYMESDGIVQGFEFQLARKDGATIWVSENARAVRDEGGKIQYYEGSTQDITERKQAQEALRQSEERYRDLVENSHEFIGTHDLDGLILSANNASAAALGVKLEDFIGRRTVHDILAPEFKSEFDDYMAKLQKEGASSGLMVVLTSSGERRIWQYYNSLRTEGVDKPIVRGIARDITEQLAAEKALRESEERYRELFENSRDAIYVHDLTGRYISVNRAAEEISGYTREEILGKHYSNFVLPTHLKTVRENFCRKLDVPLETTYESKIVCKDGTRKPVEVSSRMIYRNGEPAGVQGTVRDITERKRAQRALQTYSRRLVNAQEAEREIIARELHDDIGQSLTAISINLESIHRSGAVQESAVPRLRESIDVIDAALRRVRELSFELRPALLDDLGLAAALTWYAAQFSERTRIRTIVTGELPGPEGIGRTVETACFRIVQEALTNTARHAGASEASINAERSNGILKLTISDNGVGFAVDKFLGPGRAANAIGLRGMQERASAVGGRVHICSENGKGTQVVISLPTAPNRS
jgi:PAS domain S-box-containing protein